ncbi:FAD-dependent monooxygenase [Novosphingobium sp. KCTC 2891]|uniref:FAD-dependent oxidoreductase n=1 Tax=Novosphingobium sp. KCTC 2891 TaxID=2989730 RepID=UPI00222211C5|nr:NAD(P)/FAD-dependent oxidoreductase [Novosphingobium sp. KCTC 2891]MCW1382679.1 FAD-dependent monooxygenase [Novosphingobium sp. KCTC 2891]
MSYDLIVIGGGLAGSALAAVMARAGKQVLLLEKSTEYEDRVRGEWISPWGVTEVKRVGLYDTLMGAGGHHLTSHVTYDETVAPGDAEAHAIDLGIFAEGISGPLCLRHPVHCQTLFDKAGAEGAITLRGVTVTNVELGGSPSVTFVHDGVERTAHAPLVVGAEGRQSTVRRAAGRLLQQDKPHHWFAGLLVDDVNGWDETRQAIGTEDDFAFLAFPQGGTRVRVYGGWSLDQAARFAGKDGADKFLAAFRMKSAPKNEAIARGTPAGPLYAYYNNCSIVDVPHAPGTVLVGDAAGWNDPILGLGQSITYRDVRMVTDILKDTAPGAAPDFRPYEEERRERMRRLRFVAHIQATLDMEFGEAAKARRHRYHEMSAADPTVGMHAAAVLGGPDIVPPEVFTPAHAERVLGGQPAPV